MRLFWRIFLSCLACTLLAVAASLFYAHRNLHHFYQEEVAASLHSRAALLGRQLRDAVLRNDKHAVARGCGEFAALTQTRMTLILPDGTVLGDSSHGLAQADNHADRPEIQAALRGGTGRSVRFSGTTRRTLMYLALPLRHQGDIVGVVRASLPLSAVDQALRSAYRKAMAGVLLVVLFVGTAAFLLARRISRPLEEMRQAAERMADGDLRARIALLPGPECSALAESLNRMAAQLDERLQTILRQSERQRAVFASMIEGVLTLAPDGRVQELNQAAARLLDCPAEQVRGRELQEVARNFDLQRFIASALAADDPLETELVLHGSEERFLQLHGTALKDASGIRLGALVVLHDITRLKRLEAMRRDFVANLSHELKTPVTALQGCVETLASDLFPDADREGGEARRFLEMMQRQVARLDALVNDLLSLARLEHEAERRRLPIEPGALAPVLSRAVLALADGAQRKQIAVALDCPGDLLAPIHAPLLEQAVANLLDNAIKYSGRDSVVTVRAVRRGEQVGIQVRDQGPGIEQRHLARLFERFYRVDQARSRNLGGTGLGLAIVKHVALVHGGSVDVESTPGEGSVFTIHLPLGGRAGSAPEDAGGISRQGVGRAALPRETAD